MSKTYFIGDLHFGHAAIIKYTNRPYCSVGEMNIALVNYWNNIIGKHDVVFCLGDFALSGKQNIMDWGNVLNGRKTLVLGNHDGSSKHTYYNAGFEYVSKYPLFYKGLILSHQPVKNTLYPNIHAHTHDRDTNDDMHFCTSVEQINYQPILFDKIASYFEERGTYDRNCYTV